MDETYRYYSEQKKEVTKEYIPRNSIFMKLWMVYMKF